MLKNLIFIILDGVGDIRSDKFGNKTPLENEALESLNFLAKNGVNGIVYVTPGIAPESNSAVLSLLGYPSDVHGGRGPLEAIGAGLDFKDGMLGLRCNFATADGSRLIDRRAGRSMTSEEAAELANAINENVRLSKGSFIFKASVAHRAVLIIEAGQRLSANISNTDPAYRMRNGIAEALKEYPKIVMESKPLKEHAKHAKESYAKESEKSPEITDERSADEGARLSSELLNEFTKKSQQVLNSHPVNKKREEEGKLKANVILSRDAGNEVPKLPDISEKYGKKWAILADMPLEIGIGKLCGMEIIDLPLPTFTKADYPIRAEKVIDAMENYSCLYVHLKGPDLFGHDGEFEGKKQSLEEIDRYFFKPLLKKIILRETLVVVTGDHATPCASKAHSADPVPLLICGSSIKPDGVQRFNESDCAEGSLGALKGLEVMDKVMEMFMNG